MEVRGEGEEREAPGSPGVARGEGKAPRSSRGGGEAWPAAARWAPPGFVGNATRLQQPPQLREETALSGARLSRGQPQHRGRECRRPAPSSSRCPPSTAGPALSPRGEGPRNRKETIAVLLPGSADGAAAVPHRQRVPAAGCPAPSTPRPGAARLGRLLPFLLPSPAKPRRGRGRPRT